MATAYDPTAFGYQNFYSALLTADITSGSLTISLDSVPSASQGILVIDPDSATSREVIFYTSKGASTITLPSDGRGWAGTSAASHLTGTTVIMADVASYFSGLADGTLVSDALRTSLFFDFIVSGGTVAISSGLVGTFSNIVFYLNGRRYSGTSIANKTYTASKDTYVDITGNSDGTVTVAYNEVANNAASPALTTNYLRVAIVTTSGAAITNVNQGQENQVIPIASGVAYSVVDSIGNLICPRDPMRRIIGYRESTADFATASAAAVAVTGLSVPVIVPTGRRIKVSVIFPRAYNSSTAYANGAIFEGATLSALTAGKAAGATWDTAGRAVTIYMEREYTPTTSSIFLTAAAWAEGGGTATISSNAFVAGTTHSIKVELV